MHNKKIHIFSGVTKNRKHISYITIEWSVVGGIIAVIILFCVCLVALVVLSKHGKLKDLVCCKVSWGGESNDGDIRTIFNQMVMMSKKSSNQDIEENNVEQNPGNRDPLLS